MSHAAFDVAARPSRRPSPRIARRVLSVGSGPARNGRRPPGFDARSWDEIRLDVDPRVKPDLLGSVLDMRAVVPDGSFDALWCSHVLEHLHGHEVVPALIECRRVLKQDGFAVVTSPDLAAIAQFVLSAGVEAVAYTSPAGPISGLDMLFGHGASVRAGRQFMVHKTGFTADRMGRLATEAGFAEARVACGNAYEIWALLLMPDADRDAIKAGFGATDLGRLLF